MLFLCKEFRNITTLISKTQFKNQQDISIIRHIKIVFLITSIKILQVGITVLY